MSNILMSKSNNKLRKYLNCSSILKYSRTGTIITTQLLGHLMYIRPSR